MSDTSRDYPMLLVVPEVKVVDKKKAMILVKKVTLTLIGPGQKAHFYKGVT
uniref:Uncharacterized protein n=1 Tax=Arion vulgaris TaxID=1028688 RepID=A0A0B7ALN8_9EUPU